MSARRGSRSGTAATPPGGSTSSSMTPGSRRRSVTPRKALRIEEQHELQGLNGRLESYGKSWTPRARRAEPISAARYA